MERHLTKEELLKYLNERLEIFEKNKEFLKMRPGRFSKQSIRDCEKFDEGAVFEIKKLMKEML